MLTRKHRPDADAGLHDRRPHISLVSSKYLRTLRGCTARCFQGPEDMVGTIIRHSCLRELPFVWNAFSLCSLQPL